MNHFSANTENKNLRVIESKIYIVETYKMAKINPKTLFYFIYFEELSLFAIFKDDLSERQNMTLPLNIYRLSELKTVNYRIAQELNQATFYFKEGEKAITFDFETEKKKEEISDKIKNLIKDEKQVLKEEEEANRYNLIELKYKLVKLLESSSFAIHQKKYDYRYYLNFDYTARFVNIYNKSHEEHKYYYNRFFIGKIGFISKTEKELKGKDINKLLKTTQKNFLVMFLLSRGLYDLRNKPLKDYTDFALDFTKNSYLPNWMECDSVYLFKEKNFKQVINNKMIPFNRLYKVDGADSYELLDTNRFVLKLKFKERIDFFVFNNIIEIWKFYSYINILKLNHLERKNSIGFNIKLNLRVLFDDHKFSSINNVMSLLIEKTHILMQKDKGMYKRKSVEEDTLYHDSILQLYENLMVSFYSLTKENQNVEKFKTIIEEIHKVYFIEIQEVISNKYTEVV